jgi:hypothetical protein
MESDKSTRVSKPVVDEDYLMNIMSGDEAVNNDKTQTMSKLKENKPKEKIRVSAQRNRIMKSISH